MTTDDAGRRLMFNGVLVFLLGLASGLILDFGLFTNARMGLAAHLEGVLNGMFLAVLGLIWPNVRLPPGVKSFARWLAVGGGYLNWIAAFWAAAMGRGRTSPIHPADRPNYIGEHLIVEAALAILALAFIVTCIVVLYGLRRQQSTKPEVV
jgi:(hydroxyamino)benzene mutase